MTDGSVLVIVPAYNEAPSVGDVVDRVSALGYPVCVVDDGSVDGTAKVAERAGATVLRMPVNLGVGGALRCAFRHAIASGYEIVVQVDGDGQHDPADIPGLLERMRQTRADMVVGSRFLAEDGEYVVHKGRRLVMSLLSRSASLAAGCRITDATCGFRAIREPLLTAFARDYPVEYLGDTFEALVSAGRRGATIVEHPIRASHRRHGSPSAGLLASGWFVIRVLAAAALVQGRSKHAPLDGSK